jgi:hypothetical protein
VDFGLPLRLFGLLLTFLGAAFAWSAKHQAAAHHEAVVALAAAALLVAEPLRRSTELRWFARVQ